MKLKDIAIEVVRETDGNTSKGAKLLLQRVKAELPKVYEETKEQVMLLWAQEQIAQARTRMRTRTVQASDGSRTQAEPNAPMGLMSNALQPIGVKSIRAIQNSWFEWPLADGIGVLGDANRLELKDVSSRYLATGTTFLTRGKFLKMIVDKLPDDKKTVREVLTLTTIERYAQSCNVIR